MEYDTLKASGRTIVALHFELGIWPIQYEIDRTGLIFFKHIRDRQSSDPCLQVYKEMLKFKDEPNRAIDVLGLRVKYNRPLNDDNIRNT